VLREPLFTTCDGFITKETYSMRVLLCYFSATGNTEKIAKAIGAEFRQLGMEVEEKDVTPFSARSVRIDLEPYEAFVFGAPIYSWRAPRVFREWLSTLDGRGRKCSMFFTYGGFQVPPTHASTKQILEEQDFVVVSSAEFLGAHTFNLGGWKAVEGRPDESDYEVARGYARKTEKRFRGEDPGTLGEMEKTLHTEEKLDSIETFRFHVLTQLPTRQGEPCSMCMICEESCPTGAMKADVGEAEQGKCIGCLGCVAKCPEDALKINDMSENWAFKLEMEKITEEGINQKKSRIYL
jgi:ferredoxin